MEIGITTDSPHSLRMGSRKSKKNLNFLNLMSPLILGLILCISLLLLPCRTFSAPTNTSTKSKISGIYVGELLKYVEANKCPFPVASEISNGTEAFDKISSVCNNETTTKVIRPGETISEVEVSKKTFLCVAVADFISRICTKAKESPESSDKVSMSLVDEMKTNADSFTVTQICEDLRGVKPKTEDINSGLVSRFNVFISQEEAGRGTEETDAQTCEVACTSGISTGKEKSLENVVNPACLFLKKELQIMKALDEAAAASNGREGVSDFKPEESRSLEVPPPNNIPVSASADLKDGDKVNKDPAINKGTLVSSSSMKPDKHNISPVPSNIDEDMQGDEPKMQEPMSSGDVEKPDKKKDEKVDSSNAKDIPLQEVPKLSSSSPSSSTISSADKNRINSEEVETPPAAEKPKPSESSNNGDKMSAQEQKPPTDDEKSKNSFSNNDNKVSSSPASETVSSSSKDGAISPQQKPSKASNKDDTDNFKMDGENYDANGPLGEIDDGEDNINLNNLQNEKPKDTNDVPIKNSNSYPNKIADEGDGRMPLESPNSPSTTFDDVDGSGGYFNYFIFFLTVMALCFFAFHNKRRILAFVVEGRRPRGATGRTRRRSSGSSGASYRRLENNFE